MDFNSFPKQIRNESPSSSVSKPSLLSTKTNHNKSTDRLSPIVEREERKTSSISNPTVSLKAKPKQTKKTSHAIGKGPSFVKYTFNVHGRSPLVSHFLKTQNGQSDPGLVLRVSRTEMENPPPYPFPEIILQINSIKVFFLAS